MYIKIIPNAICNLKCVYCSKDKSILYSNAKITKHNILDFVKDNIKDQEGIIWEGYGEIFCYRDFQWCLDEIYKLYPDLKHIIFTNGTVLQHIYRMSNFKNLTFVIKLNGIESDHNALTNSISYERILDFCRDLIKHGATVKILTLITNDSINNFKKFQTVLNRTLPNRDTNIYIDIPKDKDHNVLSIKMWFEKNKFQLKDLDYPISKILNYDGSVL